MSPTMTGVRYHTNKQVIISDIVALYARSQWMELTRVIQAVGGNSSVDVGHS